MNIISTILYLILGLIFMAGLGYPVVKFLLPAEHKEEFGGLLMLPVGYLTLCLGAFVFSGSFALNATTSTIIISACLWTLSISCLMREKKIIFQNIEIVKKNIVFIGTLLAPITFLMFWPLLINGSDTYVGANNPDYFAGLIDNYFLLSGNSVSDFTKGSNTYYPLDYLAGSISSSGRFASGLFAITIEKILRLDTRESLTLSIALFLSCLPLTIYFFSRIVFGLSVGVSKISAWLIGMSAPVTLSYLYFYLGQNSGLPALPLTLTIGFLLLTKPNIKLLILFSVLANALFVTYLGMLPYVIAPLGILGLYLLFSSKEKIYSTFGILFGFICITLIINLGMIREIYAMVMGWSNVIGQTLQGQYFLDFLTEQFFPLYLGIMAYPMQSSWYYSLLGDYALPVIFILTGFVCIFLSVTLLSWVNSNRVTSPERVVTVISAILIYTIVWWVYTMQRQYGYAVFKMASWLQFMLVPLVAHGISLIKFNISSFCKRGVITGGAIIYLLTNLIATTGYGIKGLGYDTKYGAIVNNFGMSGNRDYFEVSGAIKSLVGQNDTIGISFVDSIQNFWLSYYLKNSKISILSHENIPGDDENLPDLFSGRVTDYYGGVREANNVFFHGATDQYYLTWNKNHINRDIAQTDFSKKPIWENNTFRLFRAEDASDLVFTGRGFYRTEYLKEKNEYWWPDVMRWTAEGGEIYLLRPSQIGKPYRLKLDTIVGLEFEADSRTIELWANGIKFDEFKVNSSSRHISQQFVPKDPVTKIVIKVKERVGTTKRPLPLWNRNIPADYRQLNILLSNIRVQPDKFISEPLKCKSPMIGNEVLTCATWFNGIQIDRWIGKSAEIAFGGFDQEKNSTVIIKGFLPGNLGFDFPYRIKLSINNEIFYREIKEPGEFLIEIPFSNSKNSKFLEILFEPAESADLKSQFKLRRKIVTQSMRLDAIEFK